MIVNIDSRYPVNMTVSSSDFGKLFATMDSAEQASVLRSIIEEMECHPIQWDYIAIEIDCNHFDIKHRLREKMEYITKDATE